MKGNLEYLFCRPDDSGVSLRVTYLKRLAFKTSAMIDRCDIVRLTILTFLWVGIASPLVAENGDELEAALEDARGVFLVDVEAIHDLRPAEPFPNYWTEYEVVRGTGDQRITKSLDPDGLAEDQRFWIVTGDTVNGYTELLWIAPENDEEAAARLDPIVEADRFAWSPFHDSGLGMSFGYKRAEEPDHWLIRGFRDNEEVWTLRLNLEEPMEVGGGMRIEGGSVIEDQFLQALPDPVVNQIASEGPVLYITSPVTMQDGYLARSRNHLIDPESGHLTGIADASQGPARGLELFDRHTGELVLKHKYGPHPDDESAEIRTASVFDPETGETTAIVHTHVEYGVGEGDGYGWVYLPMNDTFDSNAFARDMLAKVGEDPVNENFVFSSFSILTAFGMTYAGARSDTAAEMEQVFHFPGPDATHGALADLAAAVEGGVTGEEAVLRLANRIWLQEDWPAEENFLNTLDQVYGAPLETADFKTQPDVERTAINDWVYDRTWERIEDLLPADAVNTLTRFVLVNALYFRAPWQHPFHPDATTDADFELPSGESATVRMMRGEHGEVPYIEREYARAIALPVEDGDFSFVVVLPEPDASLEDVRTAVAEGTFALDYGSWSRQPRVDVSLPRFRVEAEFDLKELLVEMGVTDAFDRERADFTGIYTGPEPNLHLTASHHKAFIEVIESGLEAAAATAVVGGVDSVPPQFRVDRPFLFFITEDTTESVLFSGQVTHPENPPEDPADTAGDAKSYEDWFGEHFSEQEPAGPGSDPGGTGIPVLLRYAFALDPHRPDHAALPVTGTSVAEGDGKAYLTLTYTRNANAADLIYRVRASDDLAEWVTLGDDVIVSETAGETAGTKTVTVRDSKPIGESERRYLRIGVELANE